MKRYSCLQIVTGRVLVDLERNKFTYLKDYDAPEQNARESSNGFIVFRISLGLILGPPQQILILGLYMTLKTVGSKVH